MFNSSKTEREAAEELSEDKLAKGSKKGSHDEFDEDTSDSGSISLWQFPPLFQSPFLQRYDVDE